MYSCNITINNQKLKGILDFGTLLNIKEGDKVLDLFGGSGSTLIACEELNRKCYTMELSEEYCKVIIERWETLTGKKAVLLFN